MATGNFFWAPTLGLGNTATMQTLNWQALRCPLLPTAYSDLNWMKGWAVSEHSSNQLIPARLARLACRIGMDERHGESEGLPREQRAVCWEIRADTSWGSSGLIPAQVIKRVKASDTCRLTQQEAAGETLPEPTGWIMSQCPKVTVTMITPVHLDSFIQKQHFFYIMSSLVNNIVELNKALGLYYLLKTCEYFILFWFSSLALLWEGTHTQKSSSLFKSVLLAPWCQNSDYFLYKKTPTVHQVRHIKQYKLQTGSSNNNTYIDYFTAS